MSTDDVVDLLTHLVEKSLVVFHEQQGRYGLLETVRQYGREKLLEAGEEAEVSRKHRDWYLTLAEQADPELRGPRQKEWLDRLEVEHDNLRAALEWSRRDESGAEAGLRLAGALHWFWYLHDHWTEARGWLGGALARSSNAPISAAAMALLGGAHFAWRLNDNSEARALCEQGLALCRELGDVAGMSRFLRQLGAAESNQGDYPRAKALMEDSLALARKISDKWQIGHALSQVGLLAVLQGDFGESAPYFEESLALSRATGDKWLIAYCLRLASIVPFHLADYKRAEVYLRESLALCVEIGNRWVAEVGLAELAAVAAAQGNHHRAARLFGAAEALHEALGPHHRSALQAHHAQQAASARNGLGEESFAAAWAEGRAMTLKQAVEYALAQDTVT